MWNIRKEIKKGDYIYALVPEHPRATKNGYVLMHRVVMENKLGRLLERNEDVHHKDENRKNNDPNNLEVRLHGEHQRLHAKERYPEGRRKIALTCDNCGEEFERYANQVKKRDRVFCSRRCNGLYNGFKNKPS